MSDDDLAGPSLLLAQHHNAHREHLRNTHTHQIPRQHQHHHRLHRRQEVVTDVVHDVVTQVVATISIVQLINVDSHGNTLTVETILADPSSYLPPPVTLTESSTPGSPVPWTPESTYSSLTSSTPSPTPEQVYSTTAVESSTSSPWFSALDVAPGTTSTPLTTAIPSSSLLTVTNSTTLTNSSSSTQTFSNSSISTRSSHSYLRSSRSSRLSSTGTSTFLYSSSLTTGAATGTELGPVIGAGTGIVGGPASTSSAAATNNSGSESDPTPTPVVVGSVVGSIAGVALIIVALLFLLRWKKRSQMLSLGNGDGDGDTVRGGAAPTQPSGGMTERKSIAFAVPAALASLTGYKRHSQKTDRTISSTAGSERGFYRVSGRKLPSVLQTGGDGYGGGIHGDQTLSGSSFYRDSQGFYGGPGSPASPPLGASMVRDSGIPVMRPSPARTPVTEQGPFVFTTPPPPPATRPDLLGRSHPSQDGSHTSKFTEEV